MPFYDTNTHTHTLLHYTCSQFLFHHWIHPHHHTIPLYSFKHPLYVQQITLRVASKSAIPSSLTHGQTAEQTGCVWAGLEGHMAIYSVLYRFPEMLIWTSFLSCPWLLAHALTYNSPFSQIYIPQMIFTIPYIKSSCPPRVNKLANIAHIHRSEIS